MDAKGYFTITDRKKDMIVVSGFKVFPNEIEGVVAIPPGVLECGVVGVPDDKTGEAVKVVIVKKDPKLTKEAVFAHCKSQLTGYKLPRYVEFRDSLAEVADRKGPAPRAARRAEEITECPRRRLADRSSQRVDASPGATVAAKGCSAPSPSPRPRTLRDAAACARRPWLPCWRRRVACRASRGDFDECGRLHAVRVRWHSCCTVRTERVLVAWDGGREASRAVGDALPILARAKHVTVTAIHREAGDRCGRARPRDWRYLHSHGIDAKVDHSSVETSASANGCCRVRGSRHRPHRDGRLRPHAAARADSGRRNPHHDAVDDRACADVALTRGRSSFSAPVHRCRARRTTARIRPRPCPSWRRAARPGPGVEPCDPLGPPRAFLDGRLLQPHVGIDVVVLRRLGRDAVMPVRMARLGDDAGVVAAAGQQERDFGVGEQIRSCTPSATARRGPIPCRR